MDIQIINPVAYPSWDELLVSTSDYSFFHSSKWARVLAESYGYTPLYFTVIDKEKLRALVPLMEIRSILTRSRGVSLPFTDYCEPIIDKGIQFQDIFDYIIRQGKKCKWKFLEIRGGAAFLQQAVPSLHYIGHMVNLSQNEEQMFSSFQHHIRKSIRKAISSGVEVKISNSLDSLEEFYRLNLMTRKRHGLPPQPYHFFKSVYDHIISKNMGIIVLASFQNKAIASNVYFHIGQKVVAKYGASDTCYQHLRPTNLVYWEGIKWYIQKGYKTMCFGRTEPENEGLLHFKAGWGAEGVVINYYKYDLVKDAFVQDRSRVKGWHNKMFTRMPNLLLKMAGSVLYKHIA